MLLSETQKFMQLAISLAKQGLGLTAPNPAVGAVIVEGNEVIGEGFHKGAGLPHAEIEALNNAISRGNEKRIINSKIFVTLEPCSTYGRTGPCTQAIIKSGIKEVYFGCLDPNPQHQGGAVKILNEAGIACIAGVLEQECRNLIKGFRTALVKKRPYFIGKVALTLDGKVSLPPTAGRWISCEESREDVHQLRSEVDAILVGGETVRIDNPSLNIRGEFAKRRPQGLQKIILTQKNNFSKEENIFKLPPVPQIFSQVDFDSVFRQILEKGAQTVLIESGGALLAQFLKLKCLDELILYYAPIIAGKQGKDFILDCNEFEFNQTSWHKVGRDIKFVGVF